MHLSLPHKTNSTHREPLKLKRPSKTAVFLVLYVIVFAIFASLGGCSQSPKPVDVGMVVTPNRVQPGPLPQVVAETQPKPVGYFQQRRIDRLTKEMPTPLTPTPSMSPTSPAATTP